MFRTIIWPLALTLMLACSPQTDEQRLTTPDPPSTTSAEEASQALNALVEAFFEEYLALNPRFASFVGDYRFNDRFVNDIGPVWREQMLDTHQRYLEALKKIDRDQLDEQDLLSYMIFERARRYSIESRRFPRYLLPINQFSSTPNRFALLGSGAGTHPFKTKKDYEDFLKRIDGFVIWMEQARTNMREGQENGIVQPTILMERTLPQLSAHIVDDVEESIFYQPIVNMPAAFSAVDRERLTASYREAIATKIVPSYRQLHDFIRDEYLLKTRDSVGLYDLPDGEEWYAFLVRKTTTTDLTPGEIHQIGLSEVERILEEMRVVMIEVGFEGDLEDFFDFMNTDPRFYFDDEDELLGGYRALREIAHPATNQLFARFPRADYEIRPVEAFRARSAAGASYRRGTPDGIRPGVFYVNTYDLSARPAWNMEALFLHEAVPGHHFQGSLASETGSLPRFRRYLSVTAYSEGWGLYAESLGKELGLYIDPYQYFGKLNMELWRAIRLVVDTGIHAKGWSRQQVLDYMYANSAVVEARAVAEAERFMAIPSQALAYKIGQLRIAELRRLAEDSLGDQFDIKAFHGQVLDSGPLPLNVLEEKVEHWIDLQSAEMALVE